MELVFEKEDLLVDHCGKDPAYNFYRHAGIGVTQPRGDGVEEKPPLDVRGLMP
jgi:NADH-quinone oxidoreductase subunit I